MKSYLLPVVALVLPIALVWSAYPTTTIKCFSSMTEPDNRLICPAARAEYCVKEVSSLTENLCGKTQYFGDVYKSALCEFKKCSDECVEETISFEFEGNSYSRSTYCCSTDYCNSATSSGKLSVTVTVLIVLLSSWYLYT